MADPAYSRASLSTLPKECSLSLPAAYRGLLLGSPFPFSLTPFAVTIYLSLEVAGTRACSLERLVEPETESEEASVWAQCLPLTGREGAAKRGGKLDRKAMVLEKVPHTLAGPRPQKGGGS